MATAADVAQHMLDQLKEQRDLHQETVVFDIRKKFGDGFVYTNENGNLAIARAVLTAFRKLTNETVIWDRSERLWRFREDYDLPGRQQN